MFTYYSCLPEKITRNKTSFIFHEKNVNESVLSALKHTSGRANNTKEGKNVRERQTKILKNSKAKRKWVKEKKNEKSTSSSNVRETTFLQEIVL